VFVVHTACASYVYGFYCDVQMHIVVVVVVVVVVLVVVVVVVVVVLVQKEGYWHYQSWWCSVWELTFPLDDLEKA
jgi:hypothetical protein